MKYYKKLLSVLFISLFTSINAYALDLPLGEDENSIYLKTTQEADEHFDKQLPFGPNSIRFSDNSLWVSDGLKDRIVEFDTDGNFLSSIQFVDMPYYSTVGDFCFGYYGKNKEKAIYLCDADNPIIYVFNMEGKKIGQFGSLEEKTILLKPFRIEFEDGNIYILDTERSNIFVYNTEFCQGKAIVTYSKNFEIENSVLSHIDKSRGMKVLERYNLKSGERTNYQLNISEDTDIDFIGYNNDSCYFGETKSLEDSNTSQYQVFNIDKNNNKIQFATGSLASFLVKSFIKDNQGKIYQIKYNPEEPSKLTIDQLKF